MARSSRRRGAKIPGVSMNTSCAWPSIAMPRNSVRVVCTLGVTIATLLPTSALISVDLPALGAPISAMKPQRVPLRWPRRQPSARSAFTPSRLSMAAAAACSAARLERPSPSAGSRLGSIDRDAKLRIVMRPGALDLAIGRRRQAARLRPFLQDGLGIAQRPHRRAHALAPELLDELGRGVIAAVEIDRADQRLADVGEDRGARPAAGVGLRSAEPQRRAKIDRARHVGAGLAAHEIGEPPRQFALVGLGKGAKQHVGDDQPEHVVAEKFEPLIAVGAAAAGERRDVGERALEQIAVLEPVADGLFQRRSRQRRACGAPRLARRGRLLGARRPAAARSFDLRRRFRRLAVVACAARLIARS